MLCSNNERSEINYALNTEFQPSLLRGLRANYSVLTSWEEMYRIITQDRWVADQTQLYRTTHDDKYKHALPAVTTAVQLDGKGKAVENIVGYTSVTHCDFDHVPAERLSEVMALAKSDPHTLLCNVSPSGNGVHIYARYEGNDYFDAFMSVNCYYADLLNLPFDEQCSNPNKTLSLSHDPEAYFNPNAEVFVVTHTDSTDLTDCFDGGHLSTLISNDITNDTKEHIENPLNLLNPYATKTHWVKEYTDPIEFAEKYVREKQGLTYAEGYRNTYLYNCLNMMNLLGVPRTDTERWTQAFDLPEREKQSILKSAYKRTNDFGKFERPYVWKEVSKKENDAKGEASHPVVDKTKTKNKNLSSFNLPGSLHAHTREADNTDMKDEDDEKNILSFDYHAFPEHEWPPFIQRMVDCATTKPQKDVLLLGALCVIGAMMKDKVYVSYGHKKWNPSMQVFVVAPAASGKGCISWVRRLAEPLHDARLRDFQKKKEQYDLEKTEWDNMGKDKKGKTAPVMPPMSMFLIAGNNSSTGILENLADADGWALVCESEADTLSAAINSDYGHWDDMLRKAHDHDSLSYNRRTNKEYREIKRPKLSVLISGTPAQVKPMIPSAENGLFSRQLFATLPPIMEFIDQFGTEGEEVDYDETFEKWGRQWLEAFNEMTGITSIRFCLSEEQMKEFNETFATRFHSSGNTAFTHHMKSSVLREPINILRLMMVVAFSRAVEIFDNDFDPFADDAETRSNEPKYRINSELLYADPQTKEVNRKIGAVSRYELTIRDDDFHAVLDMSLPLYRNACDILTLLPSTEVTRQRPSVLSAFIDNLPMQFTREEILPKAIALGINEQTLDTRLYRLKEKGHLIQDGKGGTYRFNNRVAKRG